MKKKTFTSERVSKGVMVGLSRAVKKKKSSSFWGGDGGAKCPPFPGKEGRNSRRKKIMRVYLSRANRDPRGSFYPDLSSLVRMVRRFRGGEGESR